MFQLLQTGQRHLDWMRRKSLNRSLIFGFNLFLSWGLVWAAPNQAAENIRLQYGPLELSITKQELETFADTGEATGSFRLILSRLSPAVRTQLQQALTANYEVDALLVNRFSYTRSGEKLLTELGTLVKTESGLNGFQALRGALTLAALEPEGLNLLNFIDQFPTDIRINLRQALRTAQQFSGLLTDTQQAMAQLTAETEAHIAAAPTVDFSELPDPRQLGDYRVLMQTLELYDRSRDRTILTDFYMPEATTANKLPVIVVSNGLGAKRSRFNKLAEHLASHGFAVALIDHPGSDRERLRDFYQGLEAENFEPTEYIDRPLDVSFLLDTLTQLNPEQFDNRLDPDQAGVFGYSFGGTTALALAGATIDLDHLQQDCSTRSSLINISLLYQCQALEIPETSLASVNLKDDRIQAIYIFVPFSRSLYGPNGMANVDGPVFFEATDLDVLTPLVVEQLPAFSWLTQKSISPDTDNPPDRYLAVTAGLPHARITFDVLSRLTKTKPRPWEEIRPIAESYHHRLSTAFFQVHLANNNTYRPYLQASGVKHLSQEPYTITWQDTD